MVSVTRMWPVTSQPVTRLTMVTRVMPGEGGFGALQRVALALRPLRSRRGGRACRWGADGVDEAAEVEPAISIRVSIRVQ